MKLIDKLNQEAGYRFDHWNSYFVITKRNESSCLSWKDNRKLIFCGHFTDMETLRFGSQEEALAFFLENLPGNDFDGYQIHQVQLRLEITESLRVSTVRENFLNAKILATFQEELVKEVSGKVTKEDTGKAKE